MPARRALISSYCDLPDNGTRLGLGMARDFLFLDSSPVLFSYSPSFFLLSIFSSIDTIVERGDLLPRGVGFSLLQPSILFFLPLLLILNARRALDCRPAHLPNSTSSFSNPTSTQHLRNGPPFGPPTGRSRLHNPQCHARSEHHHPLVRRRKQHRHAGEDVHRVQGTCGERSKRGQKLTSLSSSSLMQQATSLPASLAVGTP